MYDFEKCVKISAMRVDVMPFHVNKALRIIYVLEGEVELTWVAGKQNLSKGEIEIINILEPIAISSISADNIVLFYEIDMEFAKRYADEIDAITYNCNGTNFFQSADKLKEQFNIKEKLIHLYEIYTAHNLQYKLPSEVMSLMFLINDEFNDIRNLLEANSNSDIQVQRFLRINRYLIDNTERKIHLSDIAQNEYLSPHYISKEFRRLFEKNFQTILDYYRMKNALRLLIITDDSVSKIAEKCGFSAMRYFNEKFKSFMGCTPNDFRKKQKNTSPYGKIYQISSSSVNKAVEDIAIMLVGEQRKAYTIQISNKSLPSVDNKILFENFLYIKQKSESILKHSEEPIKRICEITESSPFSKPDLFVKELLRNVNFKDWWEENIPNNDLFVREETLFRIAPLILQMEGEPIQYSENYLVMRSENKLTILIFNSDKQEKKYMLFLNNISVQKVMMKEHLMRINFELREFLETASFDIFKKIVLPITLCETITNDNACKELKVKGESVSLITCILMDDIGVES